MTQQEWSLILEEDMSEEYISLLQVYAHENYTEEFVQHMRSTALMSHFKYGWVKDKPYEHYTMLAGFEDKAFAKDKNLEHMVNIANYAMFRYVTNKGQIDPMDLVEIGVEAMRRYKHPEEGEFYEGTDSDKSVVKVKPKQIRKFLRQMVEDSPYEMTQPLDEVGYSIL